jgi:hypothetical protein
LDEGEWKVEWKTDDLYTIILKIYYTLYTIKLKIYTQRFYCSSSKFSKFIQGKSCTVLTLVWEEFLSVALCKPLSRRSKRWPSLTFWYTSVINSKAANVVRRLTSRCLECKQPSRVGGSPLRDVVSSFLCHTHTDGKDKLLKWPNRSCLLFYVNARIH